MESLRGGAIGWRLRPNGASRPLILVSEDDPEMREILVEALEQDGWRTRQAADGQQLLQQLERSLSENDKFSLIISDVRMPICSGLLVLEQMRERMPKLPVIFITAFPDQETRARAASLGAYVFDKPFDVDDLRTAVLSLLDK